jgi:Protein of unknown function (DUF1446).
MSAATPRLRIAAGSAYAGDDLRRARVAAESGVDVMCFDRLAERTLAMAHARQVSAGRGQDEEIDEILAVSEAVLRRGGRVIGNFGAANVAAGLSDTVAALRAMGLAGTTVGAIHGDDVTDLARRSDWELPEFGGTTADLGDRLVAAHAYIGADLILSALHAGAQVVIGGRLADPSLFVAPICAALDWALDDWDRVATATCVGHLLECGAHVTGGNFVDPPVRTLPDPHRLGVPIAEVYDDGVIVTKPAGTGGGVTVGTVKTQLLYEIHDPSSYVTPDVVADFSTIRVEPAGPDRVRVGPAKGKARPDQLKVLVGVNLGWRVVAEISFGGLGCVDRARLAEDIVRRQLADGAVPVDRLRADLIGVDSLGRVGGGPNDRPPAEPREVRLRVAAICPQRDAAREVARAVDYLYLGPAGAGGAVSRVEPAIGVTPAYVDRTVVPTDVEVIKA